MIALRADLRAARAEQPAASDAPSGIAQATQALVVRTQAVEAKVAALENRPAPAPADGFKVGNTTFKMGGYVKANAIATRFSDGELAGGSLGKEFYLPQQIPVGGVATRDFIGHARQTRLFFSAATPLADRELKAHIEFDFALAAAPVGAQRATNPYTPTFRRGFIAYGDWLIGQEWTTFQNPGHLPETTDFVGPMEGAIFARQMMLQYRRPLGNGLALYLAAENPQTETETTAAPALVDNDHDRLPDFVAKLAWKGKAGELHVAGLARQLSVRTGGIGDNAFGWGVSAGGKLPFGAHGQHDLRFVATYGKGVGRYFSAGFVPDAIYDATVDPRLHVVGNFAGFAALKLSWSRTLRSTFMGGYQHGDYPDDIAIAALSNLEAYSLAGNLFWSPVPNLDLGIEYRHAQRKVTGGLTGRMDRLEMAAKYNF